MAAPTRAPSHLSKNVIIYFVLLSITVRTARSYTRYDRQTLLELRSSASSDFRAGFDSVDALLPGILCLLARRRGKTKRGKRAGVLCRTRQRNSKPPLPSILLANLQSLDNKLDELRARIKHQQDIRNCCVLAFTETWLEPSVPDCAITPDGFTVYRGDRTKDSGKKRGGGVCFMVNSLWARDVCILKTYCSQSLELLTIKVRPFYLPREFSSVLLSAVYIPPHADKATAMDELYDIITGLENKNPEAAFIVLGDFNRANMKKVLPKYYQHISFPTRGDQTLDHCYTPFKECYKPLPRPAFGKADHCSILLLPAYRQRLKQEKPASRVIYKWDSEAEEVLQDCFETTDWQIFVDAADGNINELTDSVIGYIGKCMDDIITKTTVRIYPNQKPWVNKDVRAKLKVRTSAFNSGDADAYKAARYDLRKSIKKARKDYRDKMESSYHSFDTRRLWNGLRCITDYKKVNTVSVQPTASLADELNNFYARFDADNREQILYPQEDSEAATLTLKTEAVRWTFKKVNPHKAPGPDGIPGRLLRVCADELAEVFTNIFNLSLRQSVVPTSLKASTIIPVPKKSVVSCLNDYRPVALTSVIMKCLERLVKGHICSSLPDTLDPLQFAYRTNRATEDAIALATHTTLTHLEKGNTYARMLFIDYSSAFNTIIPSKLATKLVDLGLGTPICRWILNFLTNRPQVVRVGKHTSSSLILNTGTPQGCVLSPLLYSLFTHDCVAKHESNIIIKFADDTTIIGLITDNDETAYREEVMALYEWCLENNLTLNISKTREMIVDYRKRPVREHQPIHINGVKVERVSSFKFLGVNITEDFSWTLHTDTAIRKARQRLYFLRRLRRFGMNASIISNFYRCAIESLLTSCITVWYGSCSASSRKSLQRVVKAAEHITGTRLPAIQDIYHQRCLRKAHSIIKDHSHPAHQLFSLLPSGRRYRSLSARTTRLKNSFYHQAIRHLNHNT
uniref:Reverse transcriptase domain-containing protein n=1 Tax=Oreochromis niloticus TaxID=8128 RepID=A0A669B6E2_ORENI